MLKAFTLLLLLLLFSDPGTQFPGNEKITLCSTIQRYNAILLHDSLVKEGEEEE